MIIYSEALAQIARPIVDAYEKEREKEFYKIEWIEESLDDFYKAVDEFCKLYDIDLNKEEQEMDRDQYKCIAVYSDIHMTIHGLDDIEYLLNKGWLIDETIEHDDFVMYIMHHFPVVDGE